MHPLTQPAVRQHQARAALPGSQARQARGRGRRSNVRSPTHAAAADALLCAVCRGLGQPRAGRLRSRPLPRSGGIRCSGPLRERAHVCVCACTHTQGPAQGPLLRRCRACAAGVVRIALRVVVRSRAGGARARGGAFRRDSTRVCGRLFVWLVGGGGGVRRSWNEPNERRGEVRHTPPLVRTYGAIRLGHRCV